MKNSIVFLTFALIFTTGIINSQDLITLINGEEIESKVLDVLKSEIRYKRFSNIEGPTYSIKKSNVFMIEYQNGEKELFTNIKSTNEQSQIDHDKLLRIEFKSVSSKYYEGYNKISKNEFIDKIKSNPVAYNQYNLGKNLYTAGNIISIPAGFIFGYNLGSLIVAEKIGFIKKPNATVIIVSGLFYGGGLVLYYEGRAKIRGAINTYNTSGNIAYKLNLNQNGIGIVFQIK